MSTRIRNTDEKHYLYRSFLIVIIFGNFRWHTGHEDGLIAPPFVQRGSWQKKHLP
ncbi:hypothetical protein GT23_1356 [Parageobacillus thermoglucosidasius]|nr:hypothetical protein GT23_1356 [Parageobacillus thermoglucosidasius]